MNLTPYFVAGGSYQFLSKDKKDSIKYVFQQKPFRIFQYINGKLAFIANDQDTLQYASNDATHTYYYDGPDQIVTGYEVGMGFTYSTDKLYGIPQRAADKFNLQSTQNSDPYRLFNQDEFIHPYGSTFPLYGAYPQVTGHSTTMTNTVIWMNSAETYVGIFPESNNAMMARIMSIGGVFEFFTFGSGDPKRNAKYFSDVTGRLPMPPIPALGYHFC